MKWLFPVVLAALLAGCGVEWFPAVTAPPTTTGDDAAPAFFNFSTLQVTVNQIIAKPAFSTFSSNTITLKGKSTKGWPITFTAPTSAHASLRIADNVDGPVTFYDPDTTIPEVFPGQTLRLEQVPTFTIGQSVTSQVKVGTFTASFILSTVR